MGLASMITSVDLSSTLHEHHNITFFQIQLIILVKFRMLSTTIFTYLKDV